MDKVTISTPDAKQHAPVRGTLEGSNDGRIWFRLGANPVPLPLPSRRRRPGPDDGNAQSTCRPRTAAAFTTWDQVVALSKTAKPTRRRASLSTLSWARRGRQARQGAGLPVVWHGKVVQPPAQALSASRSPATRQPWCLTAAWNCRSAGAADPRDLWLDVGTHEVTIFSAAGPNAQEPGSVPGARSDASTTPEKLPLVAFKDADFDLKQPGSQAGRRPASSAPQVTVKDADWEFRASHNPVDVRYVRLVIHEYRGEAVAINHVVIADSVKNKIHIPTETDLLSLATNDILEIAGGDVVHAATVHRRVQPDRRNSRLLTSQQLTATYHNATITADRLRLRRSRPAAP